MSYNVCYSIAATLRSCAFCLLLSALACPIHIEGLRVPGPSDNVTAATRLRFQKLNPAAHVPDNFLDFYHKSSRKKKIRTDVTRIGVCVTGQLSRLETESKLKNFLRQEPETVADVDLFAVMEVNSDIFVNPGSDPAAHSKRPRREIEACYTDFRNASEVQERFKPFYRSGLYLGHVDWKNVNWDNWGPYLSGHNEKRHAWNKEARMQSHLNQWFKWSECSDLIQKAEQEDVSRGGKPYDLVVRIRDNGIVVMPWSVTAPGSKWLELQSVAVKGCSNHGGVHDKFMVAPRSLAIEALTSPFTYSMKVNSGDQTAVEYFRGVRRPEAFLRYSWLGANVPVRKADTRGINLPVVDGRCLAKDSGSSTRSFCIVTGYKDCHPDKFGFDETTYQTCPSKTLLGQENQQDWDGLTG
eukprot:gnl/TRDRNA2_/TRDRNA2_176941_c0_seq57.p1 gnl/TRDRNA2_/TRDRNA2_176941_c0~~gnl/TRDRNA2_/TRDRNA2_176941_c0_seq57.p1  ORF type:complete len:411 (+),score=25.92 gnl/TRDRNA2_/TRDRNA2_176941_c0_seq57:59-1291(+)